VGPRAGPDAVAKRKNPTCDTDGGIKSSKTKQRRCAVRMEETTA